MRRVLLCLVALCACSRERPIAAATPAPTPLIVLDGRIVDAKDFHAVTPEGIERIDVLKGEAAIKTYGPGAKNGVIVVITKNTKR